MITPPAQPKSSSPAPPAMFGKCLMSYSEAKADGGDQLVGWDFVRIFAKRHVSNVEQPARFEISWQFPQRFGETRDGSTRAALIPMNRARANRQNARFGTVIDQAIGLFAKAQLAKRNVHQEIGATARIHRTTELLHLLFQLLIRRKCLG